MSNFKIVLSAAAYKPIQAKSLEKDENGYYKVRLGAFNVYNSAGDYYAGEGVEDLITNPNSFFYRRIKKGYLKGEMDHPKILPSDSRHEILNKLVTINSDRVSHHIREVVLTKTNEVATGRLLGETSPIIAVDGWIKPTGPKGKFLQEVLDNPQANVAFSVRSTSEDVPVRGIARKKTNAIFTWDWVSEPGVAQSNKFDLLSNRVNTESLDTSIAIDISKEDIEEALSYSKQHGLNLESSGMGVLENIYKDMMVSDRVENINRAISWL